MTGTDEAVWQQLHTMMPLHDCGQQLRPGGLGDQPYLVCVTCGYIEEIDADWAADMAAHARRVIELDGDGAKSGGREG